MPSLSSGVEDWSSALFVTVVTNERDNHDDVAFVFLFFLVKFNRCDMNFPRSVTNVPNFQAATGQRRPSKMVYLNRFTKFVLQEIDKGMQSIWVVLLTGGLVSIASYRVITNILAPSRELAVIRTASSKAPLSDSHNAFWGLRPSVPAGYRTETMTDTVESDLKRPSLVHSERSSVNSDIEWILLELSEFDTSRGDDVYYRSVHGLHVAQPAAALSEADKKKNEHELNYKAASGKSRNMIDESPTLGHIHGQVKCKGITSENNCVPYAGTLSDELSRKLMLALGPVFILRDAAKVLLPWRYTFAKEVPTNTLVFGLHGGELPRWLSAAFPNFNLDVVENDAGLVKMARRYLGFRESSNLHLHMLDPIEYARQLASREVEKRYDFVIIDCVDSDNRLSTNYGRLEFINNIRNGLSPAGVVAVNLPNKDPQYVYNMVQNWRMAFPLRTILLVHCTTTDNSVMLAFQDSPDRGKAGFGTCADVNEFQMLLKAQASHYGNNRVGFDLLAEVTEENFRIFNASKEYPLEYYLPAHHPFVRKQKLALLQAKAVRNNLNESSSSLAALMRKFGWSKSTLESSS